MAAGGRGGGDRLSSGGAASAPFGPTEKPMRLCATMTKVSFVFDLTSYVGGTIHPIEYSIGQKTCAFSKFCDGTLPIFRWRLESIYCS
jgi:hypothetical protein